MTTAVSDLEDIGKLFVGGLSSATNKESLQEYFSQFGEVIDSVVMKNAETGKTRGFGFITFRDPNCIYKVLHIKNHELDGKKIDPKECTPRSMQKSRRQTGKCKVFMGGLPPDITEEAVRSEMSKFGKVDQVVIMVDQETGKCRGFGFLSFELEESIDQACAERFVIISGKQIECKRAEPRINPKRLAQSFAFPKDQNGFSVASSYGQISPVPQNNWNVPMSQPLYNFQGNALPSFQSYGNSGIVSFNTSSPGYPSVQALPYAQQFTASYGTPVGSYSYSPVSAAAYNQTTFATNSQTPNASALSNAFIAENEKTFESSDYSSNSAYVSSKGISAGGKATDATFMNQNVVSSPNYQRYHPYKA